MRPAEEPLERLRQGGRRQRPGGEDGEVRRDVGDLLAHDAHPGQRLDRAGELDGEVVAVDRQARPGGYLVGVGDVHHQGAEPAHLVLQEPDGGLERRVPERVGAHELAETVGMVRGGAAAGPHLVEIDGYPVARELPRGLRAGESAADDGDAFAHVELARRRAAGRPAPSPAVRRRGVTLAAARRAGSGANSPLPSSTCSCQPHSSLTQRRTVP